MWNLNDDSNLLRGVYDCGFGNWESIKIEPSYKLQDKVCCYVIIFLNPHIYSAMVTVCDYPRSKKLIDLLLTDSKLLFFKVIILFSTIIIILYFENVAFFHAKLGSDVCSNRELNILYCSCVYFML